MSQPYSHICYVVCYRESSVERKAALDFTLRRVHGYFPEVEILVAEQDNQSKLHLDKNINYRHLFIHNPNAFNRSWAFNCAVKISSKDVFVFADADIFLDKDGYETCFDAANDFEAITPNKRQISNVEIDAQTGEVKFLNQRILHSFAGGMLLLTRKALDLIHGWDERFEGWGGEDNAMSHIIYNRLRSTTLDLPNYHIDHPHENVSGKNHVGYAANRALVEEVESRNGPALDRYIEQLGTMDLGNPKKYSISTSEPSKPDFVLAVTTYNRLDYLKKCIGSFISTKGSYANWQLIIADDNSSDGTKEYLDELAEEHQAIIIHNDRKGIHHQVNSILKKLSDMDFDLCFRCDDDIEFLNQGWDDLYWKAIRRAGYPHLVFYDKNWLPHANLSRPIETGNLIAHCHPEKIQGAFYTLTKEMIRKVGFFDVQQFGSSGLGHVDYTFRSCRLGFNVLAHPFDVDHSNDYIALQSVHSYKSATSSKTKSDVNSQKILDRKWELLKMDRNYIPYNENKIQLDHSVTSVRTKSIRRRKHKDYKRADSTFYPERGVVGFLGTVLKRIYNVSLDLRLYFIPKTIKWLGKFLNKLSIHIINIEQ